MKGVDQNLLDKFSSLLDNPIQFEVGNKRFKQYFRRTPNAYKVEIVDIEVNKVVASGYVFGLREKQNALFGTMGRLLVKEGYRGLGLGSRVFDARINAFGKIVNLKLNAYPNRSSDLTEENFKERQQILFDMYGRRGFIRKEGSSSGMYRKATND